MAATRRGGKTFKDEGSRKKYSAKKVSAAKNKVSKALKGR